MSWYVPYWPRFQPLDQQHFGSVGNLKIILLTLIGKSWKTHPEIFLKFSFSGSSHRPFYWKTHPLKIMSTYSVFFNSGASHRPFYWKTHPFEFFDWNHIWYVTFGLDEFSSKTACVTPQNSPIDDWMSFPVKRSRWRPGFFKNWIGTQDFLMDEFSSKTASEMSQKFANKG